MTEEPWNLERVQRMIEDGVEESIHLDYKGAGSLAKISQKRDEIIKDVTAFANSDGGVIIYGVSEYSDAARKHLPQSIDPIKRSEFSREWLEQVISNASPRIHGLRIYPVPIPGEETQCLYVVEIPKGETAHQAPDCKYYRRYNFESVPMRDHEVRDVLNRIKVPRIVIEAYLGIRNPMEESSFLLKLKNVSARMAKHFVAVVRLPTEAYGKILSPVGEDVVLETDDEGSYFGFALGQERNQTPLFPGATVILRRKVRADISRMLDRNGEKFSPRKTVIVTVFADEMPPLEAMFAPSSINNKWDGPMSNDAF